MLTSQAWPNVRTKAILVCQGKDDPSRKRLPVSRSKCTHTRGVLCAVRVLWPLKRMPTYPSLGSSSVHVTLQHAAPLEESVLSQKMNPHLCQPELLPVAFPAQGHVPSMRNPVHEIYCSSHSLRFPRGSASQIPGPSACTCLPLPN